jgi:hypothetical protein
MRRLAIVPLVLLLALMTAEAASACSCVATHPANRLAQAPAALVGVVEASRALDDNPGLSSHVYTLRVERAVKGPLGERVDVLAPGGTSCTLTLKVGERLGLLLSGEPGNWTVYSCSIVDPEALIEASRLEPPLTAGAARMVAAVDLPGADLSVLDERGRPVGYGAGSGGRTLALSACPDGESLYSLKRQRGKGLVAVSRGLQWLGGSAPVALGLKRVSALQCRGSLRNQTAWIAGDTATGSVLLALHSGKLRRVYTGPAATASAVAGGRAYFASRGRVDVISLASGKRLRRIASAGTLRELAIAPGGARIAGRVTGGGAVVLGGRPVVGRAAGPLTWLTSSRLLDAARGAVLDARLRMIRRVTGTSGRVAAVGADGSAFLVKGRTVRRLAPGASRAETAFQLAAPVHSLTLLHGGPSTAAAWHSCEKSAKTP